MKIFDTGGYLIFNSQAYVIKNHKFASLTPGSEHLLKGVTYVTWAEKNSNEIVLMYETVFQQIVFFSHVFL